MSDYENRPIPEGINYSDENPLAEFFHMLTVVALTVAAIVVVLVLLADMLVRFIPVEYEAALGERIESLVIKQTPEPTQEQTGRQQYLQAMADSMRTDIGLTPEFPLHIYYADDEIVNAFATLGGQIVVYRGLWEKVDSENGLAFVLAHEMAHLKQRHPVKALGRGVVIALALSAIVGVSESSVPDWLFEIGGSTTLLSFNRDMEIDADTLALAAVQKRYGHVGGAGELFSYLLSSEIARPPMLLSTHPDPEYRLEKFSELALRNYWQTKGEMTALPSVQATEKGK